MRTGTQVSIALALIAALAAGAWIGRITAPVVESPAAPAEPKILYYRNPMGLPDTSPVPKKDSMGMDYVPVYASEAPAAAEPEPEILYYRNPMGLPDTSPVPKKDSMGMDYVPVYAGEVPTTPGTVVMSPEKVQLIGVRTSAVSMSALDESVRASASIVIDQTRQHVIAPRFEGWVQSLSADQIGMTVKRGQALMTVYSPELLSAQNEYLIANRAAASMASSDPTSAAAMRALGDAALDRLRNWDIGAGSLARLQQGKVDRYLTLVAPVDAVVTEKSVVQGARFMAGETVLALADLSKVWAVANLPAVDANEVTLGDSARFRSITLPGRQFEGRVTQVAPTVDAMSRTIAVRIELDNADGMLRPALFGEIEFVTPASAPVLSVPHSAVLDSGTRQIVFVQLAEGRFEPRPVTVGRRSVDRIEIREGLSEGELVVTSANFLIDAESNLGAALQGMAGAGEAEGQEPGGHEGTRARGHEDGEEPGEQERVGRQDSEEPDEQERRGHEHGAEERASVSGQQSDGGQVLADVSTCPRALVPSCPLSSGA